MNISDLYSDNLLRLIDLELAVSSKIYQKTIEMLQSEAILPRLREFVCKHLDTILLYICASHNVVPLCTGNEEEATYGWNTGIVEQLLGHDIWNELVFSAPSDICLLSFEIIPKHYVHFVSEQANIDEYENRIDFVVNEDYVFMRDIFERIISEDPIIVYNDFRNFKEG